MTACYTYLDSPLGRILVHGDGDFVTGLFIPNHKRWPGLDASWQQAEAPFAAVRAQLAEYFAGTRQRFDVPLKLGGTPFQKQVWQELLRIPFGETITYAQLAARVGNPAGARAVGHANGRNPVAIIVPCHRVIGANGKLTGYASGTDKKQWLLSWERPGNRSGDGATPLLNPRTPSAVGPVPSRARPGPEHQPRGLCQHQAVQFQDFFEDQVADHANRR